MKIIEAICAKGLPKRDLKNANRVNLFALLWALTLLISTYLSENELLGSGLLLTLAFCIHTFIGIAMLMSYRHFLVQLDEMERKVQLDALALSVGVAIISFSSYSILQNSAIVPPLNAAYLIALIALTYMVGIIKGRISYR
ncbi:MULTISPECIES: hypothetical protein [unclassified Shewanella]|uniref:hypothetical protein n=1 Tax=unclassified Shewanella TaxID=196818 RepID=UPI001BB9B70F|nr:MULTISPECIES: hypothetical protein [unclassified Shewanella]GIU15065.1 hypothetical protein TUM4444_25730 [Shewanella sp. MBTL60-112-B1]GIU39122.1 hypothetical protein TUM4445_34700 [Shewanella sp. MBTL60-112-B2]